jgi:hypothetical protein
MSTAPSEWLTGRAAAELLNVPGPRNVRRLAQAGRLTIRDLPVRARYLRRSVEAVAAESIRPAKENHVA